MAKTSGFKLSTPAPASGQYLQVGARGGAGNEVMVPRGHVLPPASTNGGSYKLVDRTRNKSAQR